MTISRLTRKASGKGESNTRHNQDLQALAADSANNFFDEWPGLCYRNQPVAGLLTAAARKKNKMGKTHD